MFESRAILSFVYLKASSTLCSVCRQNVLSSKSFARYMARIRKLALFDRDCPTLSKWIASAEFSS